MKKLSGKFTPDRSIPDLPHNPIQRKCSNINQIRLKSKNGTFHALANLSITIAHLFQIIKKKGFI